MSTREEMQMMENYSRGSTVSERWNLMYSEQNRSPIYSVQHYITYLRKHVAETGYARTAGTTTSVPTVGPRPKPKPRALKPKGITKDSINPLSYFLRKLKLDLKMAYVEFVSDFVKAPNNGLRLLLSLLKNLQVLSSKNIGTVSRSEGKGTLKMDDYKRSMVDEQDCLLCIKYTLRVLNSTDELLEDNSGLLTVTTCLLSNFSKSRVTALEILTLIISGPSSVDKVLEAFTSIRLQYAESTRFKMLTSMMQTKGPSHVLFQVSCLRLLNNLLNMCQSSNMRVFLQYELEEAGLNLETVQMNADGDGLEFDDLRKEVREWKTRFIDVDCLLRKVKSDIKKEIRSDGLSEFYFDQKYGNKINHALSLNDLSWVTYHEHGYLIDYDRWLQYIETRQKMGHDTSMEEPGDRFLRRDVYIPDCHQRNKTLSNQSQLTDNKIQSPARVPPGKFKYGHHHDNDVSSAYDVISVNTSFCGSENTIENFNRKEEEDAERAKHEERGSREYLNDETTPSAFKIPEQKTPTSPLNNGSSDENWILKSAAETRERSKSLGDLSKKTMTLAYEGTQEMIERYDSGVSVNYGDQDYHIYSGKTPSSSIQPKPDSYKHIFYTGHEHAKDPYIAFQDTKPKTSMSPMNFNSHDARAFQNANNQVYNVQMQSLPVHQNNAKYEPFIKQNYISPVDPGYKNENNGIHHGYGPNNARNFRPIVPSSRDKVRTPSPDYIIDGSFKPLPLKTSTTRSNAYVRKPISHQPSNQKPVMGNRNTSLKSSSLSNSGNPSGGANHNNLSPKRTTPSALNLKQNGFHHYNKNSPGSNVAMKQAFFEDKVILNVKPTEDYVKEVKQPASLKRLNGNLAKDIGKDSPNVSTENALNAKKGALNGKQGGEEVYSSEVNEILMGLDKTLEQNGWKDSIRVAHTTKVPFEAYI